MQPDPKGSWATPGERAGLVWTVPELRAGRVAGQVLVEHNGRRYRALICNGCEECWRAVDYPHLLRCQELKP